MWQINLIQQRHSHLSENHKQRGKEKCKLFVLHPSYSSFPLYFCWCKESLILNLKVCVTTLLSLNDFSGVGCLYLIYRLLQIFKIFDLDFLKINYENAKKNNGNMNMHKYKIHLHRLLSRLCQEKRKWKTARRDLNSFFFSFSKITNASRAAYPSLHIHKHKKPIYKRHAHISCGFDVGSNVILDMQQQTSTSLIIYFNGFNLSRFPVYVG